jgi:hypothetical protein
LLSLKMRRLRHLILGLDNYLKMYKVWGLEDKIKLIEEEKAMIKEKKEMKNEVTGLILETIKWKGRKRKIREANKGMK